MDEFKPMTNETPANPIIPEKKNNSKKRRRSKYPKHITKKEFHISKKELLNVDHEFREEYNKEMRRINNKKGCKRVTFKQFVADKIRKLHKRGKSKRTKRPSTPAPAPMGESGEQASTSMGESGEQASTSMGESAAPASTTTAEEPPASTTTAEEPPAPTPTEEPANKESSTTGSIMNALGMSSAEPKKEEVKGGKKHKKRNRRC
jgi:hypothetical protein